MQEDSLIQVVTCKPKVAGVCASIFRQIGMAVPMHQS